MDNARLKITVFRGFAVFGAISAFIMLALTVSGPSVFPEKESLTDLRGTVAWVQPTRYGLRFGFEGDRRTFAYAQRSGNLPAVAAALKDLEQQPITVWIEQKSSSDTSLAHQVLEIRTATGALRTRDQVKESWAEDYQFGYLVVLMLFCATGVLEYQARKLNDERKQQKKQGSP